MCVTVRAGGNLKSGLIAVDETEIPKEKSNVVRVFLKILGNFGKKSVLV